MTNAGNGAGRNAAFCIPLSAFPDCGFAIIFSGNLLATFW